MTEHEFVWAAGQRDGWMKGNHPWETTLVPHIEDSHTRGNKTHAYMVMLVYKAQCIIDFQVIHITSLFHCECFALMAATFYFFSSPPPPLLLPTSMYPCAAAWGRPFHYTHHPLADKAIHQHLSNDSWFSPWIIHAHTLSKVITPLSPPITKWHKTSVLWVCVHVAGGV